MWLGTISWWATFPVLRSVEFAERYKSKTSTWYWWTRMGFYKDGLRDWRRYSALTSLRWGSVWSSIYYHCSLVWSSTVRSAGRASRQCFSVQVRWNKKRYKSHNSKTSRAMTCTRNKSPCSSNYYKMISLLRRISLTSNTHVYRSVVIKRSWRK